MLKSSLKYLVWILIFSLLLLSFGRSIWMARQAHLEVEKQAQEVQVLEQEVQQLENEVQEATSSYELERRVREELHLQRPEEVIIKLPEKPL